MIEITKARAVEVLAAIVDEFGEDYRYVNPDGVAAASGVECMYVHGDKPGCIAGHALHRLGVPLDAMKRIESETVCWTNMEAIGIRITDLEENYEDETNPLYAAQAAQDRGETWGEALSAARGVAS